MNKNFSIIRSPSITEKSSVMRSEHNRYVFEVSIEASKTEVKSAIESIFNVKVEDVNTMVVKGKFKRMGKHAGYRSDWKKAIVKLAAGHSIDKFGEV